MVRNRIVLVVVTGFPVYSETFVSRQVADLTADGWDVHVACTRGGADSAATDRGDPGSPTVHMLDRHKRWPSTRARRVARVMAARDPLVLRSPTVRRGAYLIEPLRAVVELVRPAMIHSHFGPNAVAVGMATTGMTIPAVADLHGFDICKIPHAEGWSSYRRHLRDQTLVVHSQFAADVVARGLARTPRIVRYDVDPMFESVKRSALWSMPLEILFVGRLVAYKGVDVALEALAHLLASDNAVDARLTVVGSGPEEPRLRGLVSEFGLDTRVDFRGERPPEDVAELMKQSDVLVVPSMALPDGTDEAFGLVAREGLRTGMAVIASRTGGLADSGADGAHLVEPGDPVALSVEIQNLLVAQTPASVQDAIQLSLSPVGSTSYLELTGELADTAR